MKQIKYIIILLAIFLMTDCRKSKDDINPLILGDWKLTQVYEGSWITVPLSSQQTLSFNSNGQYSIAYDGSIKCNGTFMFVDRNNIKMNPSGCMPIVESEEEIFTLTSDTLTISNKSLSISSYFGRKDKYIKIK